MDSRDSSTSDDVEIDQDPVPLPPSPSLSVDEPTRQVRFSLVVENDQPTEENENERVDLERSSFHTRTPLPLLSLSSGIEPEESGRSWNQVARQHSLGNLDELEYFGSSESLIEREMYTLSPFPVDEQVLGSGLNENTTVLHHSPSILEEEEHLSDRVNEDVRLLRAGIRIETRKELVDEPRAWIDLTRLARNPGTVILSNVTENQTEKILESMFDALSNPEAPFCEDITPEFRAEAMGLLLTSDADGKPILGAELSDALYGISISANSQLSFVVAMCESTLLLHRHFALARLSSTSNLGMMARSIRFFALVCGPVREKPTKRVSELGKTIATMLSDGLLRYELLRAPESSGMLQAIRVYLEREQHKFAKRFESDGLHLAESSKLEESRMSKKVNQEGSDALRFTGRFAGGFVDDFTRRLHYYVSDWTDGFRTSRAFRKSLATTFFLYFACLLPTVAFGVLNERNTDGFMNVRKNMLAQASAGIVFCIFGGQAVLVVLTSAPLALTTKVIYDVATANNLDFGAFYAWVGIWSFVFLTSYALLDVSAMMKYSARSVDEIFSLFISIAFISDSITQLSTKFDTSFTNCGSSCARDEALLYLILLFGTLLLGLWLYRVRKSSLLGRTVREIVSDYALPAAVVVLSFFGSYVFRQTRVDRFSNASQSFAQIASMTNIPGWAIIAAAGFGLLVSFLLFMDQNIVASLTQQPHFKLRKGSAMHWDLFVTAVSNLFLGILGLPWVNGAIPHSPLHARALAEVEEVYVDGSFQEKIVRVYETRIAGLASHILIALSLFLVPTPLDNIPIPVLYGVFLYVGVSGLDGNQFWERVLLLFTEQQNYPPTHYIRRVPQRQVHFFTLFQVVCCAILCTVGLFPEPYVRMFLPLTLVLLLPARRILAPKMFDRQHLAAIDNED